MDSKAKNKKLSQEIAIQSLTLASSSLGLVAALAWNEAIKEIIDVFIKPYLARGSGVISLLIYAIFITAITIAVALQIGKIQKKIIS